MSAHAVVSLVAASPEFVAYREAVALWVTGDSLDDTLLERTGAALCRRSRDFECLPEHMLIALRTAGAPPRELEDFTSLSGRSEDRARRYRIALDRLLKCYFG